MKKVCNNIVYNTDCRCNIDINININQYIIAQYCETILIAQGLRVDAAF